MPNEKKINVMVSKCLLGISCRWHGKKLYKSSFVKKYEFQNKNIELIPVCPETLAGLSVPRPPVKRKNGKIFETCPDKKNRKNVTGKDVTEIFLIGAEKTLKIAKKNNVKTAIFCKYSPSCDINGKTGKLLADNGIKIINTW